MRTRIVVGLVVVLAAARHPHGQTSRAFEAASVKPSVAGQARAGMRMDTSRVELSGVSLADLIAGAFQTTRDRVKGPRWLSAGLDADRFEVRAVMPAGATIEQVPEMLQSLLAERFGLVYHREQRQRAVLALVVAANGPRLERSADASASGSGPPADARPRMAPAPDGAIRLEADGVTMASLARMLARYVGRSVIDMTGIDGAYRIALTLSREDMLTAAQSAGLAAPDASVSAADAGSTADGVAGVSIVRSLGELGLALVPRTAPVEEIVLDRLERTPTPD